MADGAGGSVGAGPTVADEAAAELALACSVDEVAGGALGADSGSVAADAGHAIGDLSRTDSANGVSGCACIDFSDAALNNAGLFAVGGDQVEAGFAGGTGCGSATGEAVEDWAVEVAGGCSRAEGVTGGAGFARGCAGADGAARN